MTRSRTAWLPAPVAPHREGPPTWWAPSAFEAQQMVLVHMTTDYQRGRLVFEQVPQTMTGGRRPEPVGRRGGQLRASRGHGFVCDERDLRVLAAHTELVSKPYHGLASASRPEPRSCALIARNVQPLIVSDQWSAPMSSSHR